MKEPDYTVGDVIDQRLETVSIQFLCNIIHMRLNSVNNLISGGLGIVFLVILGLYSDFPILHCMPF